MTKDEAQACHWRPHRYKQINSCFPLKRNTDVELEQTTFLWKNRTKNTLLPYARYITYGKVGYHVELQTSSKTARCESLLANIKTPSGSWREKDAIVKIILLPAKDPMCW